MSTRTVTDLQRHHREAFGRRLRQLREAHSQEWLADRMEVDRRTVMRLEAGKVPAELHLIAAANKALGCGIGALLESLLPREELSAEIDSQLLYDAAYQRARVQKERLDREVAVRYKRMRAEFQEMETLFGDTDRQLKELEARFKQ